MEAFGATSEPVALQRADDLPQPLNLRSRLGPLTVEGCSQLADHPMQRCNIIRQSSEIEGHEPILSRLVTSTQCYCGGESIGRSLTPPRPASIAARVIASQCPRSGPTAERR